VEWLVYVDIAGMKVLTPAIRNWVRGCPAIERFGERQVHLA
jgi:hypothetical protein